MDIALLIGNGINQLAKRSGLSWGDLLQEIQKDLNTSVDLANNFKPFPLAFEEILFTNCRNYDSRLRNIKKTIAKALLKIEPNSFHRKIMASNKVSNIITTNYDYAFEKCVIPEFPNIDRDKVRGRTKETKNSLRRVNIINEKSIWHIHGELKDPKEFSKTSRNYEEQSILIGYEHYSDYLNAMHEYRNGRNAKAEIPLEKKLSTGASMGGCWIDYFFSHKMFMIGIDLSFSEIDLWWLLNYRSRLFKQDQKAGSVVKYRNTISYIYPHFPEETETVEEKIRAEKSRAKAELLKAFEIDLKPITAMNYEDFYEKFINVYL